MCFVLLAEKCHGQQEDRDLLHGGEEECWQRGEESKIQTLTQHTHTSTFLMVQKGVPAERIHPAKGLSHLARWYAGLTWGFCFWFCLLCMHGCVSVCELSPLSSPSTCCWALERQQPNDSRLLLSYLRERGIQVCVVVWVCMTVCVCVCVYTLHFLSLVESIIH